jgi:hypothetical protein
MALLILTYWRVKVQPEAIPWLTARGTGGTQHVCKITGKTAQLYDWFRHQYPGCSGRALMSLGLMTFRDLQQQGHGIGSIVEMVQGEEATLWPS